MFFILGIYVTLKLNQLNQLTRSVAKVDSITITHTENLLDNIKSQVSFSSKYLVFYDKGYYKRFHELEEEFAKDMEQLEALIKTPEKVGLLEEAKGSYDRFIFLLNVEFGGVDQTEENLRYRYKNQE